MNRYTQSLILLVLSLAVAGAIGLYAKRGVDNKELVPVLVDQPTPLCEGMPDKGVLADGERTYIFSTECVTRDPCSKNVENHIQRRYYLANFDKSFIRQITMSSEGRKDILDYGKYILDRENINLDTVTTLKNQIKKVVGLDNDYSNDNDRLYIQKSPDGTKETYRKDKDRSDEVIQSVLYVKDIKSGQVKSYDFRKDALGWNGIYVAGWSASSRYLYVAGGIYEIIAPAKLWRIDTWSGTIKEYPVFNDFAYPITVLPEYQLAFANNNSDTAASDTGEIVIVDLESGKQLGRISEVGHNLIGPIYYRAGSVYYLQSDQNDRGIFTLKSYDIDYKEYKTIKTVNLSQIWSDKDITRGPNTITYEDEGYLWWIDVTQSDISHLVGKLRGHQCETYSKGEELIGDLIGWEYPMPLASKDEIAKITLENGTVIQSVKKEKHCGVLDNPNAGWEVSIVAKNLEGKEIELASNTDQIWSKLHCEMSRSIYLGKVAKNQNYLHYYESGWEYEREFIVNMVNGKQLFKRSGDISIIRDMQWSYDVKNFWLSSDMNEFSGEGIEGIFVSKYNNPDNMINIWKAKDTYKEQMMNVGFRNNYVLDMELWIDTRTSDSDYEQNPVNWKTKKVIPYTYDFRTGKLTEKE